MRWIAVFFLLLPAFLQAQTTYLHCGRLIDGVSDKPRERVTVIIEGENISGIDNGFQEPEGGTDITVIDLSNQTVMPGWIDMHVHIEHETSPTRYIEKFTEDREVTAFKSIGYAEKTLMAGFTTVRDLGGSGVNTALRDAIAKGWVKGPRIFSCGKSLATTGGHADPTNGYRRELMPNAGPKEGVCDGPSECREAVRWRYKNGADLIKITATGGVLSLAKSGQNPQFTDKELEAIVETANDYGFHVAVHAHGTEGMKRAVLAGVTTIEHGTFMTEEVMDLMIERGVYYVPTITAGKYVAKMAKVDGYYPEIVRPKALAIGPQIEATFAAAYKHGVPICFGTDASVYPHGENWKEFGYMVDGGMPPMEVIQSATIVPARILKMEDQIGSIEAGKLADIVAVTGNPLEDMAVMKDVVLVMKEGVVYKLISE